ncbi:MAG: aspartate aminotransferase family protein [Chloroflexi bacterium]|nr:aspartate aminotransferase family protein [Chloroflexota bacterium]
MTSALDRLTQEADAAYRAATPNSAKWYGRAQASMPGGDTRQSVFFEPYPLFLDQGAGAYVTDVDGNRYLDCANCWTALVLGHAHPAVVEAVSRQIAKGTAFGAANHHAIELAELLQERLPGLDSIRFANTGSEGTMLCVRASRAFTGRPKILKMAGAYHGSHDDFQIYDGHPDPGLIPGVAGSVIEVPFNDKPALTAALDANAGEVACVIAEGILGAGGMIPPADGYLAHVRAETERHGVLFVLDEVITLRLSQAGAQGLYDVVPDLTAFGKIVGGGYPVGAFGGRADVMQQFSPLREGHLHHSGTFNANPISMLAGLETLRQLDADTIGYINGLGERFGRGVEEAARANGITLPVTGVGSLRNVHFTDEPPHDAATAFAADAPLLNLFHKALLARGIFSASRGMFAFSAATTDEEIDRVIAAVNDVLAWLRPAVEERAPHLLRN